MDKWRITKLLSGMLFCECLKLRTKRLVTRLTQVPLILSSKLLYLPNHWNDEQEALQLAFVLIIDNIAEREGCFCYRSYHCRQLCMYYLLKIDNWNNSAHFEQQPKSLKPWVLVSMENPPPPVVDICISTIYQTASIIRWPRALLSHTMSRALEHPRTFDDLESLGCRKVHIKRSWGGRSDLLQSFVVMNNVTWRSTPSEYPPPNSSTWNWWRSTYLWMERGSWIDLLFSLHFGDIIYNTY